MKYQSDFEERINPWGLSALIIVLLFLLVRYAGMSGSPLEWLQAVIAILLGIVGIIYNSRHHRLTRAQSEASLVIDVTPENVVHVTNKNNVPVTIEKLATKTFSIKREWTNHSVLRQIFGNLHKAWLTDENQGVETRYIEPHENMRISKDECITVLHPQTGITQPIEELQGVVQIISITYHTDVDDGQYRKSVGLYHLTSPAESCLWTVCQSNNPDKVSFKMLKELVEQRSLRYSDGGDVFVETLRQNLTNTKLVKPSFLSTVNDALALYDERVAMDTDSLPQDQWVLYRAEIEVLRPY